MQVGTAPRAAARITTRGVSLPGHILADDRCPICSIYYYYLLILLGPGWLGVCMSLYEWVLRGLVLSVHSFVSIRTWTTVHYVHLHLQLQNRG